MLIFIAGLFLVAHCSSEEREFVWKHYPVFDDYLDLSYQLFYHYEDSLTTCAKRCGETAECLSFFYQKPDQMCVGVSIEYSSPAGFTYIYNSTKYYKDRHWVPTTTTTTTTTPPPTTSAEIIGTCQQGYTYESALDICWRLEKGQAKTWDNARSACMAEGGDLIVLNTNAHVDYMQSQLSAASASIVLVGAHDKTTEGDYRWLDDSVLTGPWGTLQPDNVLNQDCIAMEAAYGFKFNDVSCTLLYNFLCQTPVIYLGDICTAPYTFYAPLYLCWRLEQIQAKTWNDARDTCISENGDLMVLQKTAVVSYMKDQLTAASAGIVYVGGNDLAVEGEFKWVDGTVFDGPWGPDQPNNLVSGTEDQDCILMESAFGFNFSDTQCSGMYNFLCQITIQP